MSDSKQWPMSQVQAINEELLAACKSALPYVLEATTKPYAVTADRVARQLRDAIAKAEDST